MYDFTTVATGLAQVESEFGESEWRTLHIFSRLFSPKENGDVSELEVLAADAEAFKADYTAWAVLRSEKLAEFFVNHGSVGLCLLREVAEVMSTAQMISEMVGGVSFETLASMVLAPRVLQGGWWETICQGDYDSLGGGKNE